MIFSKGNLQRAIDGLKLEAREYNEIKTLIKIKETEFKSFSENMGFVLGIAVAGLFGAKITGNLSLIGFTFLGMMVISGIIFLWAMSKVHNSLLKELYLLEDNKSSHKIH